MCVCVCVCVCLCESVCVLEGWRLSCKAVLHVINKLRGRRHFIVDFFSLHQKTVSETHEACHFTMSLERERERENKR